MSDPQSKPNEPTPVYANLVQVAGTPYDVALTFSYQPRAEQDAEPSAVVVMSWEHAVSTAKVLQEVCERYGHTVGPIREIEISKLAADAEEGAKS